jgi:serine/threonine protein kinase
MQTSLPSSFTSPVATQAFTEVINLTPLSNRTVGEVTESWRRAFGTNHVFVVGEGSFGSVIHIRNNLESVCVKIAKDQISNKCMSVSRAEAAAIQDICYKDGKAISHRAIVPMELLTTADGLQVIAMAAARESLNSFAMQPVPVTERLRLFVPFVRNLVEGLRVLHGHGRIHGDLSPNNILMTKHSFLICDLGSSCTASMSHRDSGTTYPVSSPEQIINLSYDKSGRRHQPLSTTSCDVWSLGCLCYFLLTGRHLFYAENNRCNFHYFSIFIEQCKLLGSPDFFHDRHIDPKSAILAMYKEFSLPQIRANPSRLIPSDAMCASNPTIIYVLQLCLCRRHQGRPKDAEEMWHRLPRMI